MTDAEMRFTNGELAVLIEAARIAQTSGLIAQWTPNQTAWLAHAKAKLEADFKSRL